MKEPKIGEVYKFLTTIIYPRSPFQIVVEIENEEIISWGCKENFQNWTKMKENKKSFWNYGTKIATPSEKIRVIKSFTLWKMSNERT